MGNKPLERPNASTIHASLARSRNSIVSLKSSRSMRRISVREAVVREPLELLPSDVTYPFELDPLELKMLRNLCGCPHPLARVDVVIEATDGRRAFVDKRIALHATASDLQSVRHGLAIHCYLTRQSMLATADQMPHPHLVALYGHFEFQQTLHILTDYYTTGSLLSVMLPAPVALIEAKFQCERDIVRAARQLCAAVAFMHAEGVAHMDICHENIFVDATGALRLGDFCHSVFIGRTRRRCRAASPPVRRAYAAPELYTGREVDLLKTDAWSIGIVIAILLTKKAPLGEATTKDTHYRLLQVLGVPAFLECMIQDMGLSPESRQSQVVQDLVNLLGDLLVCEPDARMSITEAMTRHACLGDPLATATETPATLPGPPPVRSEPI